jgi:hypothetical protein
MGRLKLSKRASLFSSPARFCAYRRTRLIISRPFSNRRYHDRQGRRLDAGGCDSQATVNKLRVHSCMNEPWGPTARGGIGRPECLTVGPEIPFVPNQTFTWEGRQPTPERLLGFRVRSREESRTKFISGWGLGRTRARGAEVGADGDVAQVERASAVGSSSLFRKEGDHGIHYGTSRSCTELTSQKAHSRTAFSASQCQVARRVQTGLGRRASKRARPH